VIEEDEFSLNPIFELLPLIFEDYKEIPAPYFEISEISLNVS